MYRNYDGFIFDLDGTIYLDDAIIPNAAKTINFLLDNEKKVVFISNKTTGTVDQYYNYLKNNNFNIEQKNIINATTVISSYLTKYYKNANFFAIGEQIFIDQICNAGLKYSTNTDNIKIVIITLDRTLNYEKLEIAANALERGAIFYAANIDDTCPVEGGEILDAGSTISALEKRTHKKLVKHFGKPSINMLEFIKKTIKVPLERCLIIGDRLETDIEMGNAFGIDTALVKTGIKNISNGNKKIIPKYKIKSVYDLVSKYI
jgi:HAD superfamily hydrolase (TIGR01450 family)